MHCTAVVGSVNSSFVTGLAIRVTPGVGLRITTPLGPARLDVAYNPYRLQPGTLFQADDLENLTPVPGQGSYVLPRDRKYAIHIAVGQPFLCGVNSPASSLSS